MDRKYWNLEPNNRINGIEFGRDHVKLREFLGKPGNTIQEYGSDCIVDVYPFCHVYYSAKGKFEAIEFYGNDIILEINSQRVYPGTLSTAKKILPDLEDNFGTYVSKSSSVGIGVDGNNIISILVGCKDYYK